MATLAADKVRHYEMGVEPLMNDLPVIAADIIYEGAAVAETATTGVGNVQPLTSNPADVFHGFADAQCDNSAGAAGAKRVRVRTRGIVQLAVANEPAANWLGALVYASDDDTFTFTSTNNVAIGRAIRKVSAGVYMVYFEGLAATSR